MKQHSPSIESVPRASLLIWAPFLLLCSIGAGAAIRRIAVLVAPHVTRGGPELSALDDAFAEHRPLTLFHIVPALAFVLLVPAFFLPKVRKRPVVHRRVTYTLLVLGAVVGVTALLLSRHPIGEINEASAAILYDCLFLFSLARAGLMLHREDMELHRSWMLRAIAVLLGIAMTRPVMALFFATESITHLHPQQFFGTAFWVGFTGTYLAGEAYIRSHPWDWTPILHPMELPASDPLNQA